MTHHSERADSQPDHLCGHGEAALVADIAAVSPPDEAAAPAVRPESDQRRSADEAMLGLKRGQ